MSERMTVMISSTARDLPEHRDQVRLGCQRAGFAPDQMMENLTALNKDAVDISLKMVEKADIYLGVFAWRYGYVPDGADISITEMEYNRAVELNKPRLIFFIGEDHLLFGKDFETGEGAARLQALKDRIGKKRVAAFFKSPEDLRANVGEALGALREDLVAGDAESAFAVQTFKRADFEGSHPSTSSRIVQGVRPRPGDVLEGCFMQRPVWIEMARSSIRTEMAKLAEWSSRHPIPIFWVSGPSGAGKSVLVLQLMRDLLIGGLVDVVTYLGEFAHWLPHALRHSVGSTARICIVLVLWSRRMVHTSARREH